MVEVISKPIGPYHATGTEIIILIVRIVYIRIHVPIVIIPVGIASARTPLVMKFIRFKEVQSQPHPHFSAQERAKLHST